MKPAILPRMVVLVAAIATFVAPVSGPAAAAPAPVQCWTEFDLVKSGQTLIATAYKDCVDSPVAQHLPLSLEIHACDMWFGCSWVTWKSGTGTVTHKCPGTTYSAFRNSRLPEKIEYCTFF